MVLAYVFLSGNSHQTPGDYKINSSHPAYNRQKVEISAISQEMIPEEQAGFINRLFFSRYYEVVAAQKQRQQLRQDDKIFTNQLQQGFPEQTGLSSRKLSVIDSIMLDAINRGAMPGGQVFIAKNGIIVYEKAFGYHDYTETHPVELTDLYDVASVTKIAATTLAAMKLSQEKKLDLDAPLGKYFTDTLIRYKYLNKDTLINALTYNVSGKTNIQIRELIGKRNYNFINDSVVTVYETILKPIMPESNIFRVPVYRLLSHQSGINPSLPIMPYIMYAETYQKIVQKDQEEPLLASLNRENYSDINDQHTDDLIMPDVKEIDHVHEDIRPFDFSMEEAFNYFFSKTNENGLSSTSITDNMYLKNQFRDSLYQAIKRIHVYNKQDLQYSDINMILLQMVMDSINQTDLDTYTKKEFYERLGMKHTTFNPLNHFPKIKLCLRKKRFTGADNSFMAQCMTLRQPLWVVLQEMQGCFPLRLIWAFWGKCCLMAAHMVMKNIWIKKSLSCLRLIILIPTEDWVLTKLPRVADMHLRHRNQHMAIPDLPALPCGWILKMRSYMCFFQTGFFPMHPTTCLWIFGSGKKYIRPYIMP
jgi:CubicO group peptidase (beta-lactamase class C family)